MFDVLTLEEIEYFKNNKNLITSELLELLRSKGKLGKKVALEILDTEKDNEEFYLDAFGNRTAYNGDRSIKKAHVKMKLYPIHLEEIKKCAQDVFYFMENYIQMMTKNGTDFADLREYQVNFIKILDNAENESIISLQPRQSGKSTSSGVWLLHKFNFGKDLTIGICANDAKMAREYLDKVKKMFQTLPKWIQRGIITWNKGSIEGEEKVRIITDATSSDSFRGFTCYSGDTILEVYNKINNKIEFKTLRELYGEIGIN